MIDGANLRPPGNQLERLLSGSLCGWQLGPRFFVRGVQAIFGQLVVQFGGLLAVNFSHDFPTLFDPIVLHEDFKS